MIYHLSIEKTNTKKFREHLQRAFETLITFLAILTSIAFKKGATRDGRTAILAMFHLKEL